LRAKREKEEAERRAAAESKDGERDRVGEGDGSTTRGRSEIGRSPLKSRWGDVGGGRAYGT